MLPAALLLRAAARRSGGCGAAAAGGGARGLTSSAPAASAAAADAAPAPEMIEVTVNGAPVSIPKGANVMAACTAASVDIPRFCYHQRLSIAGNCRMCLVEVEKSPKPVASCAMPVAPGMVIKTDTPLVKKAREGVMEFLLINHPLDCPICDQGGECDLQDQAMAFGSDRGRFTEGKRSVQDKDVGPLVKTVMTRCIHCTRCVRFAAEVAGVPELGITGRGNASEVGTYVARAMSSELAGNVIDLCPVGALTSKPYAFTARQWELKGTESIDVSDALGANVRIDARGPEVMRVVPTLNEAVNEEWLSDKGRFGYDGLRAQRLVTPLVRSASTGALEPATWQEALAAAAGALRGADPGALRAAAGKLADAEAAAALKDLWARLGSGDTVYEGDGGDAVPALDVSSRAAYTFGGGLDGVDRADAILLVGTNPRTEAAVLNARLRRAWLGGTPIGLVGPAALASPGNPATGAPLTYPVDHVGEGPESLAGLAQTPFGAVLKAAARPLIIVGAGVSARPDGPAILAAAHDLAASLGAVPAAPGDWNGWAVLQADAGRVGANDIGFVRSARAAAAAAAGARPRVVYLLHSDDWAPGTVPDGAFVIYQGSHGDAGAARADVVLPGSAYTEKDGTFVNTAGRAQATRAAVPRPGQAREDWAIVRALSEVVGCPLPYSDRRGVRARLAALAPHLATPGAEPRALPGLAGAALSARAAGTGAAPLSPTPFTVGVPNFYQTDVITRASVVMAKATASRRASAAEDEGGALAA